MSSINTIKVDGAVSLDYLWVTNTAIDADLKEVLNHINYEPSWDINTQLLARFNNSLNAGNAGELAGNTLDGWKVYRQNVNGSALKYVKTLEPSEVFVVDYNTQWGQSYIYYLFPSYEEAMGSPFVSNEVKACWVDWILLLCNEVSENEFEVEESFLFQLNTTSGTMNNNADVSVFKTYNKYPKVMKGRSNYLSGTLSSLVGYMGETDGELGYIEKIELIQKIQNLNTDSRRKFLKDKKGHVWEIELTGATTFTYMENVSTQPVTDSITWTEIASTENISIYNGNERELWLLTTTGNPEYNVKYIWIDSEYWTPSKYWTESGTPISETYYENIAIDTSDATADATDIMDGKTAYARGEKLTGKYMAGLDMEESETVLGKIKEIQGEG